MSDLKKLQGFLLAVLVLAPIAVLAQEGGAPAPADSGVNLDLLRQLVVVIIPVLTPLIVTGIKKVTAAIPTNILPIVAPVIGVILGALGNALNIPGLEGVGIGEAAALGAAGVGVREIVDQNVTGKK
jgi:hypothetical protein